MIMPDWEVGDPDLAVVVPSLGEVIFDDHTFLFEPYVYQYYDSRNARSSAPLLLDKIYFGGYLLEHGDTSETTNIVHYTLFSMDYDGSDCVELFKSDLTLGDVFEFTFPGIELWDVYENKVFFAVTNYAFIVDLTLNEIVFQSLFSFSETASTDNILVEDYLYLGQGKMVRLAEEGAYCIMPNSENGHYEEVLYPEELINLAVVVDFIDGIVIIEDRLYANGHWKTRILKGVSYEDGTWIDAASCQSLLESLPAVVYNPFFSMDYVEVAYQTGFYQVTHTEDQVSREFTKAYLISLFPDLQTYYDLASFGLQTIRGQHQELYLSFTFYDDCRGLFTSTDIDDLFLFTYDWENETLTFVGFYGDLGNEPIVLVKPASDPSQTAEISY